jgi:hypothetical protein
MSTISDSILDSVKAMLGIDSSNTDFDTEIIIYINSTFMLLSQLNVGPDTGFSIEDNTKLWSDYLGDNETLLSGVKSYMYLKVRVVFDPPATSFVIDAFNSQILELESRILTMAEHINPPSDPEISTCSTE